MKLLFDLFPVILFFACFKYSEKNPEVAVDWMQQKLGFSTVDPTQAPILLATLVVILATFSQILWVRFRHGKVDKMLWVSLVLVSVFGGLTLWFQNETFIKWKPTLLYWIFAGAMLFSRWVLKTNPLKSMLGAQMNLPEPVWTKLNTAWAAFFSAMGALNLYIAYSFSTDTWVNFKLFGATGLLLIFILAQGVLISKHLEETS